MQHNQAAHGEPIPTVFALGKKLVRPLLVASLVLGLFSVATAQLTGEVQGRTFEVDEDGNETPFPFANVVVTNGVDSLIGQSDIDGRFTIKPLKPGLYDVKFISLQKQTRIDRGIEVLSDKIYRMGKVVLQGNVLGVVNIIYRDVPLVDAENTGRMQMMWKDIERNPLLRTPLAMIAASSSEISQDEDGGLYFRGARPTDVVYFVDGVKSRNGGLGIPSTAIGGMQVYTGGVPARYGDMTGGVIVVETKSYMDMLSAHNRKKYMKKQQEEAENAALEAQ